MRLWVWAKNYYVPPETQSISLMFPYIFGVSFTQTSQKGCLASVRTRAFSTSQVLISWLFDYKAQQPDYLITTLFNELCKIHPYKLTIVVFPEARNTIVVASLMSLSRNLFPLHELFCGPGSRAALSKVQLSGWFALCDQRVNGNRGLQFPRNYFPTSEN